MYAIYDNLNNIFEIVEVDKNQVILKVKNDNPLNIAKFPFVNGEWAYITITRGGNHLLSTIKKDGSKGVSFYWGNTGHTLISEGLELLKANACAFIEQNDIILEYNGSKPINATIYYNSNYKKWQLTIEGACMYWSKTADNVNSMIKDCKKFVQADTWAERIAVTGITVWDAVNPTFTLK